MTISRTSLASVSAGARSLSPRLGVTLAGLAHDTCVRTPIISHVRYDGGNGGITHLVITILDVPIAPTASPPCFLPLPLAPAPPCVAPVASPCTTPSPSERSLVKLGHGLGNRSRAPHRGGLPRKLRDVPVQDPALRFRI